MNKELLIKRFSKSLPTYDKNATIQYQMALQLLSYLDENEYDKIFEIGCGTGLLTKLICENITFNSYCANDIVDGCKDFIKNINPNIQFYSGDIENMLDKNKYDLIISNAVFQWIENFQDFVNLLITRLNRRGTLIFSTFGKNNFREIAFIFGKTLPYYSPQDLLEMFKPYSPQIMEEIRILSFKKPIEILKHLQSTGVNSLEQISWTKSDLNSFVNSYNNLCSCHPTLTYNPIYVKILIP